MQQIGRIKLTTYEEYVTKDNIIPILQKVFPLHETNANRITFLSNYEKGYQPIERTKTYRPDINVQTNDNVANEITDFKTSYHWGSPITIVQRGEEKEGSSEITEAISLLNSCYESEGIRKKTQHLARNVEISCLGYTYIDINTDKEDIENGGSYFKVESLEPTNAFVVYSSYYADKRPMIGVMYGIDDEGMKRITAFTKDQRFELRGFEHVARSGEENPLGAIPIIEWIRSYDGLGCFERQIPEMDALNLMVSDLANDVDQETQAIWHGNDVDFPKRQVKNEDGSISEEDAKPKTNDWIITQTTPDGKTPFIKPLSIGYDYSGMLNNILAKRALILQKCNVPSRNDNSGGSTGIAMDSATGWSVAETEAQRQQNIMETSKMEEIKVALKAIQICPYVPADSPLLKLKYSDLKPSVKRSKSFELTTKVNFFATAVSHGINGLHALKAMNAFEDVAQVWEDSKELIERYQDSIFNTQETNNMAVGGEGESTPNSDRMEQDYSDQTSNSPQLAVTAEKTE